MTQPQLVPPTIVGAARRRGWFGFALAQRFFFLIGIGLFWIVPAFWDVHFLFGLGIWDLLVLVATSIDFLLLPAPKKLEVERHWLDAPALSGNCRVEIRIHNRSARLLLCHCLDEVPAELLPELPQSEVRIPSRHTAVMGYSVHPVRRGDIEVRKCFLRYRSVARLAERWAVAPLDQTVRIYPDFDEARRHNFYLSRSRQIELRKRLLRQRGMGREFESLREYQDGDEMRDICWTATARRGKLVTKLHQMERSQPVWIVLDVGRLQRALVNQLSKLDYAVNAALTLAQLAHYSGDRVGLLTYGRAPMHEVSPARGRGQLRNIVNSLATVQPENAEADHLRAAVEILRLQKRRSLVVWITDLADVASTPEVISGASRLLRRHLLLFVAIAQPELVKTAQAHPHNEADLFESTAALEVVHRRDLLLAHLRERGALALEIFPGSLTTAIVNQYLSIKERSLL